MFPLKGAAWHWVYHTGKKRFIRIDEHVNLQRIDNVAKYVKVVFIQTSAPNTIHFHLDYKYITARKPDHQITPADVEYI
jgi:hypothetical protein